MFLFQRISAAISGDLPPAWYKFWYVCITAKWLTTVITTRAQTITRAHVLVNMCHIKFALTARKKGSEDRNAVGINVELGSPFLQGISCLVKR